MVHTQARIHSKTLKQMHNNCELIVPKLIALGRHTAQNVIQRQCRSGGTPPGSQKPQMLLGVNQRAATERGHHTHKGCQAE